MIDALLAGGRWMVREAFPRGNAGVFARTAAALSRIELPQVAVSLDANRATGRIRACGRRHALYYGAACLIWAAVGLIACLALRECVARMAEGSREERYQPGLAWMENLPSRFWTLPYVPRIIVAFPAEMWFLSSTLSAAALFCSRRQWNRPGRTLGLNQLGSALAEPVSAMLECLLITSCVVSVLSSIATAYPGLLEGKPRDGRLPWTVWFGGLIALLAYRGSSPINRRVAEYTLIPSLFRLPSLLQLGKIFICQALRRLAGNRTLASGALPANWVLDSESSYLRMLAAYLAMYEREGLHELHMPTSQERRYYTLEQREAFDFAYSRLVKEISRSQRLLKGTIKDSLANHASHSITLPRIDSVAP